MNPPRLNHHHLRSHQHARRRPDDRHGDEVVRELADHVYALVSEGHGLEPVVASLLGRRASGAALTAVAELARSEAMQSGSDDHWMGVARKIDLVQNFCPQLFRVPVGSTAR